MEIKCLELRDKATFISIICIKPIPDNDRQHYLLRRDGYSCLESDTIIIMIDAQCRGCSYDPYHWKDNTHKTAHTWIMENWKGIVDGDVIDCEFIRGDTKTIKISERLEYTMTTSEEHKKALSGYIARDPKDDTSTIVLLPHEWRMIRTLLNYHDDDDLYGHLSCTKREWIGLLTKFGLRVVLW